MNLKKIVFVILISLLGGILGFFLFQKLYLQQSLISPLVDRTILKKELPLQAYTIKNLQKQNFPSRQPIIIKELIEEDNQIYKLLFFYHSQGKNISGALNVALPMSNLTQKQTVTAPVIIMIRGWAPKENYYTGLGTKNAAQAFAQAGFVTLAPDFLGYGQSDDDLIDNWEARFIKPINVIDLINTVNNFPEIIIPEELGLNVEKIVLQPKIAIWAHSNGGQIAITTLEILNQGIPSSLWAPVTAPFPYSIIFYSDEQDDEGKEMRQYLSIFERDYDVFDFSITKHLDSLYGPLQIHHGARDLEAPIAWSEDFIKKIEEENLKRSELNEKELIDYSYYRYENADHNLQGNWQTAINRDLLFFKENLELNN